jgi:hypothetical protein
MANKRKAEASADSITDFAVEVLGFKLLQQKHSNPKETKQANKDIAKDCKEMCADLHQLFSCDEDHIVQVFDDMQRALQEVKEQVLNGFLAEQQKEDICNEPLPTSSSKGTTKRRKLRA